MPRRHPYRHARRALEVPQRSSSRVLSDILRAALVLAIAGVVAQTVARISRLDPLAVIKML